MLTITPSQERAMADSVEEHFIDRVVLFFQQNLPQTSATLPATLAHELRDGIRQARSFGLATEQEIGSFLLASYFIGWGFNNDPEVNSILVSPRTGETKRRFLDSLVRLYSASTDAPAGGT